jgi:hypothetical protein
MKPELFWIVAVAGLLILVFAFMRLMTWKFENSMKRDVKNVLTRSKGPGNIVTSDTFSHLPGPVKNWLSNCGIIGREGITRVYLEQRGAMLTKPGQTKWMKAAAQQYFSTVEPSFLWKVKMRMNPFVTVRGYDRYFQGKGSMTIRAFSFINIVSESGTKIDQGALQRYLAEICWFPSAALSPFIRWELIDDLTAKAIMSYKGTTGEVIFHFNDMGDIIRVSASRYKSAGEGAQPEKWIVKAKRWATMDGIRMPVDIDVSWQLKTGDFTWYKLSVTRVVYNQPIVSVKPDTKWSSYQSQSGNVHPILASVHKLH